MNVSQQTHIIVRGHVQHVGFRRAAAAEAHRLGVAMHARNLPSGDVEVLVGQGAGHDAFVSWLHRGPAGAHVTGVVIDGQLSGFADDAQIAVQQAPRYFLWWYTVKSIGLCAAVAALAFMIGRAGRRCS